MIAISQMLKQLQIILVEETSEKLLDLYSYERRRTSMGSLSEATYRSVSHPSSFDRMRLPSSCMSSSRVLRLHEIA